MKPLLTCILLCILNIAAYAQVDSVKYYLNYKWEQTTNTDPDFSYYRKGYKLETGNWLVEDYYVETKKLQMIGEFLDKKLEKEDGLFRYYHRNGRLKMEGRYYQGNRVGLWKSYNDAGRLVDSGRYKSNGMPIKKHYGWNDDGALMHYGEFDPEGTGAGIERTYFEDGTLSSTGKYSAGKIVDSTWAYYFSNGKISALETWDNGRWISYECFDTTGNKKNSCDTASTLPEPKYDVYEYLARNIKMPSQFKERDVFGKQIVIVRFMVNRRGNIENAHILKGSYPELNEESLRVINTLPRWQPAIHKNRFVSVYYLLPVAYVLE